MNNQEKMIRWLLDAIDTEVAKPEGEADMVLVEECTALLGELTGETGTIPERELKKRYRAITRGGKSGNRKKVRWVAAIAACLAVFMVMSGCGYLPSINVILQTLFASGVGKDVEIHEITYTFKGIGKQYDDVTTLIKNENLDIISPTILPDGFEIVEIVQNDNTGNICILFNNSQLNFQTFKNKSITDIINISEFDKKEIGEYIVFFKELSPQQYITYTEIDNTIYFITYSNVMTIFKIIESMV